MIESQEPLKLTIEGPVAAFIRHLSDELLRSPIDVIGGLAHALEFQYFFDLGRPQEDIISESVIAAQRERESWRAARKPVRSEP